MAEYDLTSKIGGYLDRHLVFPMLEFLTEKKVQTVAESKYRMSPLSFPTDL